MKAFLKDISREAGRMSLEYRSRLSSIEVERKSAKDIVTEADTAVENFLIAAIRKRYPDHGILAEESGTSDGKQYRWIIDPIDGTASFLHGQPFYGVSIALENEGEIVLGVVNAPVLGEFFFAEKGHGATCNDKAIHVSKQNQLIDSMVGTGFACVRNNLPRHNLPYFNAIVPQIRGIRRFGSVSIDLSYIACGRMDAFWELGLHVYDIAAGGLILEEAGGRLTDFSGGLSGLPGEMLGSNGYIHESLSTILQEVDRESV
jgi:myo-inositol-1(or 4)-monophosphatase